MIRALDSLSGTMLLGLCGSLPKGRASPSGVSEFIKTDRAGPPPRGGIIAMFDTGSNSSQDRLGDSRGRGGDHQLLAGRGGRRRIATGAQREGRCR